MRDSGLGRPGGALILTVGSVAVAGSAAALLAAGPRLLGTEAFGGLALAWTVTTVFGFGLAVPTEQLLSRTLSIGDLDTGQRPLPWLGLAAAGTIAMSMALAETSAAGRAYVLFAPAAALGVLGWVAAAGVRGRLAGIGETKTYAGALLTEALLRVLLVGGAVMSPSRSHWLLAASVGLPILVSAVVTVRLPRDLATRRVKRPKPSLEHLAYVCAALGFQVCLNGAPLLLGFRGLVTQSVLGAFVIANSYYRLTAVLVGGLATHSLAAHSQAWGQRDYELFSANVRRSLWQSSLMSVVTTAAVVVAAPVALVVLYGRPPDLPMAVVSALAVSTVLATVAAVANTPLMAMARSARAAGWWMAGATALTLVILRVGEIGLALSYALVLGPGLACVGLIGTTYATLRHWRSETRALAPR